MVGMAGLHPEQPEWLADAMATIKEPKNRDKWPDNQLLNGDGDGDSDERRETKKDGDGTTFIETEKSKGDGWRENNDETENNDTNRDMIQTETGMDEGRDGWPMVPDNGNDGRQQKERKQ